MVEVNPHFISQLSTGATIGQIEDDVDFPHTGLFKSLMQGVSGNFVVKNNTNDFDITQSASDPVVSVAAGSYLDNGELKTASAATFNAAAFTFTTHKAYYLLVVNSSGTTTLRVPTVANRVANHSAGDTIIAMIEIADDTSAGSRKVQFFTSSKTKNSLNVAYDNSGAYTETGSITGASAGTTITSSGILTLDSDDVKITASANGKPTLTLETTGSNLANEPAIIFSRTATANAAGLDLGRITFNGTDDGGNTHNYVQIVADGEDETGGTEDGLMLFQVAKGGSDEVEHFRISGSFGNVFNSGQADIDTRIKGDTDSALFYANAGTDRVGIGVDSPTTKLEVKGDTTISRSADSGETRTLIVEGARNATGSNYAAIDLKNYDSHGPTSYVGARIAAVNEATGVNDGTLTFSTNNANAGITEAMRITDSRNVGIGTTSPSVKLDVAGAITSSGTITGVIGALTTVNATDVNTANITSTANQNLSYEVVAHPATPIITGTKTVVYIHDIAALGNTVALPVPVSGNILHVKNITAATITLTGTPIINMGDTTHPKITSANVITLAPFEHITLQGVNDVLAPLVTGHMIISD